MVGRRIGVAVAAVLALTATAASADGGPIDANHDPGGVTQPGSPVRFVALSGMHETVLAKVHRDGGAVAGTRPLHGEFAIPGIGPDATPEGLSADGRTLVLVKPRTTLGRRHTTLQVLRTKDLQVRRVVALRGDFSYDALSPDGRVLYLVQYLSASDPTRYAVRAYDTHTGRLRPQAIVDPEEHADEMRGSPVSRAYGPGGRWAYTLYDGNWKHPFVHALDTVAGRAKCIDAPLLAKRDDLFDLKLRPDPGGRTLSVVAMHGPVATVDTRTFRVMTRRKARPAAHVDPGGRDADLWTLAGFAALLLGAGAVVWRLRRRRRVATG